MNESLKLFEALDQNDTSALLSAVAIEFGQDLVLAMSFSLEDIVVLDLLNSAGAEVRLIALDTGRLPDETYEVAEKVRDHFNVEIDWYFPDTSQVEALVREKGSFSFRNSVELRQECCRIRKVEPLKRALKGARAWVTGQRKEHSPTRGELSHIEFDQLNQGLIKINPLAEWSFEQVQEHAQNRNLPSNTLYEKGYVSIGCAPCSRAIKPGEDFRAGRWWWEGSEKKECGIHFQGGKIVRGAES